jgi:hypothetical protein
VKTRGLLIVLPAFAALLVSGSPATAAGHRPLTASERRQINETMDIFVNHAVKREGVDAAYDVVTPRFRLGMSRKEWDKGSLPGFPYPAAGNTFHGWTVQYLTGNELGIHIILMPRKGSGYGAAAIPMTLRRIHGRWLVDNMVPGAFFAPEGKPARVVGTNDFLPGPGNGDSTQRLDRPQGVSSNYVFIPLIAFGLLVVILLTAAYVGGFRNVRGRRSLPPLPRRSRSRA